MEEDEKQRKLNERPASCAKKCEVHGLGLPIQKDTDI